MTDWTPERLAHLKAYYATADWVALIRALGLRRSVIRHKAVALGLHRACRLDPRTGRTTRRATPAGEGGG